MRDSTPFAAVYNAFWKRTGIHKQDLAWLHDGRILGNSVTPRDCDMQTGDVIDLMLRQYG